MPCLKVRFTARSKTDRVCCVAGPRSACAYDACLSCVAGQFRCVCACECGYGASFRMSNYLLWLHVQAIKAGTTMAQASCPASNIAKQNPVHLYAPAPPTPKRVHWPRLGRQATNRLGANQSRDRETTKHRHALRIQQKHLRAVAQRWASRVCPDMPQSSQWRHFIGYGQRHKDPKDSKLPRSVDVRRQLANRATTRGVGPQRRGLLSTH